MKITLPLIGFCIVLTGCATKEISMQQADNAFGKMLDHYYEDYLRLNPLEATQIGDNRYNDLLPNTISEDYREQLREHYNQYQDSLHRFTRERLKPQEQTSYDILAYELSIRKELLNFQDHLMPVHQFWGLTLTMPQLGSGQSYQPFKTTKDYDDFLQRIDAFSVWMDTAIVNMRKGLERGYTYPKILMERVLPQARDMIVSDVTQSIFYQPIVHLPDTISDTEKKRLADAYAKAITGTIVPAYTKLYNFLKDEYIPKTRTSAGIHAIANGGAYYQQLIKLWTTTDLTADSIFKLGEAEVARIRGEMEKVKKQMNFHGDLKAFFQYVSEDRRFMPFKTDEEVIEAFKAIESRIEPQVKALFNRTPKTPFEIRQTEAFREMSASAEYNQGASDGSRPGIFYVPVINPKEFNVSGMETLFLHEAIPGHHYQISLQQENDELPQFRKTLWFGAYGEGWALYAESLGKELGLYTDPVQYLGHLGDEMHRAIRLVVDVGLHAKGWTREHAIAYMMDNEPIAEQHAVMEIERYMAIPAQALSYKIGGIKIQELRKLAEQELGTTFNIGLFHDEVLKYGSLPLALLEQKIKAWISAQKDA